MHSTRDPGRDLHIPPGILYPTYKNIVLLFLFLQNVFVRVPILMDHPHTPQSAHESELFAINTSIFKYVKLRFWTTILVQLL